MDINKLVLKFTWKGKENRTARTILIKNKKLEEAHNLITKLTIYKATIIKTI